jgi:hypothetical protein
VAQIIPYQTLVQQHHLHLLEHLRRQYREREEYLLRLRRLLFQIEGQMRQAEIQQMEIFRQIFTEFHLPLEFPSLGDRIALQEFFTTNPIMVTLTEFLAARLTLEECYQRLLELAEKNWGEPEAKK